MISKKDVQHIAKLARLGVTKKEEGKFRKELSSILDYFNLLKGVNVSRVEPTFHPAEHFLNRKLNITREDIEKPQKSEVKNELVEAAPQRKNRHIKVKAIFQ